MPLYTEYLNLTKPTRDERYSVAVPNSNMDVLDETVQQLREENIALRSALDEKADDTFTLRYRAIPESNDCNQITQTGYYLLNNETVNKPTGWVDYVRALLIVFCPHNNPSYTVQQIFAYSTGKFCYRMDVAGPWIEVSQS